MYREFDYKEDIVLGNFISYMNKALLHRRINYLKYQQYVKEKECSLSKEEWEILSFEDDMPCSSFCFEVEKLYELFEDEHIAGAFKKLTELQQKVLYWNIVDKVSLPAISKVLKVSTNSVKRTKGRALNSLSKYLEGYRNVKD